MNNGSRAFAGGGGGGAGGSSGSGLAPAVVWPTATGTTADAAAIQAVINAAPTGARHMVPAGSNQYLLNAPIVLKGGFYDLGGAAASAAACRFKIASGANLDYAFVGTGHYNNATATDPTIIVNGLALDGNKANQTGGKGQGVVLSGWRSGVTNSTLVNTRGHGIVFTDRSANGTTLATGTGVECYVDGVVVDGPGGHGVWVRSANNWFTDGWMRRVVVANGGLTGIRVESAAGWDIQSTHVYAVYLDGVAVSNGYATDIHDVYVEGFGALNGATSITYSSGTTYGMYAVVNSAGAVYWSLVDGNIGNSPASSPNQWQIVASSGTTIAGIGAYASSYPRAVKIHDNEVSIGHTSITLQSGWNYRCYIVQGNTTGNSEFALHGNTAANEANGSGLTNTMAFRLAQPGSGAMQVAGTRNKQIGSFGAANSVDAAVVLNSDTTLWPAPDSRLTGAAQKSSNLSDLANTTTARTNLGLGGSATLNVGTSSGTVAAGDDSRITGAAQKASNLSDLADAGTARTNLGLGTAATAATGTSTGQLPTAELVALLASSPTFTGEVTAPDVKVTGTTGAPNQGRFVGVTTSGAPTSGTYAVGDYVVSQNGQMFVCTVAGTPGTWVTPCDTRNLLTTGEETFARDDCTSSNSIGTSSLRLSYFTARKSETTTQIRTLVAGTAASGATLCRLGLYLIDESTGDGTLVASTANDTALWNGTNAAFTKSWSSSYAKVAGKRYAVGFLMVGTTAPILFGTSIFGGISTNSESSSASPRLNGLIASQSDLPGSFTNAQITATGLRMYAAILP